MFRSSLPSGFRDAAPLSSPMWVHSLQPTTNRPNFTFYLCLCNKQLQKLSQGTTHMWCPSRTAFLKMTEEKSSFSCLVFSVIDGWCLYGLLKNINTLLIILTVREATVISNHNMVSQDHCRLPGVLHINVGFLGEIFRFWWVRKLCSVFARCVWVCMWCYVSYLHVLQSQCWINLLKSVNSPLDSLGPLTAPNPKFLHVCVYFMSIILFFFPNFRVIWSYCCF